jgi:hypothetical protein
MDRSIVYLKTLREKKGMFEMSFCHARFRTKETLLIAQMLCSNCGEHNKNRQTANMACMMTKLNLLTAP